MDILESNEFYDYLMSKFDVSDSNIEKYITIIHLAWKQDLQIKELQKKIYLLGGSRIHLQDEAVSVIGDVKWE